MIIPTHDNDEGDHLVSRGELFGVSCCTGLDWSESVALVSSDLIIIIIMVSMMIMVMIKRMRVTVMMVVVVTMGLIYNCCAF